MIEISHKQAQHLIREALDRRLPEEQWAVLYAHLENCAECRAYRERLVSYERDLHRLLNTRWSAARGPGSGTGERILRFRARRKKVGKILKRAGLYLLGILLVVGFFFYRETTAPKRTPTPFPTNAFGFEVFETVTPSPLQSAFNGLVAFESHRDGNAEVYLLNGSPDGAQLTNLTESPAQDTQPTWSPDGQWIAFLSDRSGKNEVYVIHVAGSRLTQLTNAPQIEWNGPLAWSYDGKWVGLSGRRGGLNGPSFLYLVPLNGSGEPRSIAYTYLADRWLRFSPGQPALAYLSGRRPGEINVVNTETGWTGDVTMEDNQVLHLAAGQAGAFDWSPGGRSLVYLAQPALDAQAAEKAGSQIRVSQDIEVLSHLYFNGSGAVMADSLSGDSLPGANRFRAVTWVPHTLIVASLVESDPSAGAQEPCWMIRLNNSKNTAQTPQVLPEICVTGGLEPSNWSPDGKWLVVAGRKPSEKVSAVYAVRLPEFAGREDTTRGDSLLNGSTYIERLAELPAGDLPPAGNAAGGEPFFGEPRVRPGGALMQFTPSAAKPPEPVAEALPPPSQAPGTIAYRIQKGPDSWIARSRPDGRGYLVLTSNKGEHSCPRVAPDGTRVAYLSDEGSPRSGINEVFVTGLDRKNTLQRTRDAFPVVEQTAAPDPPLPRYDCPVWSPDGKTLAAVHRTAGQAYLALIPVDGDAPVRYLKIEEPSRFAAPVWVPSEPGNPRSAADQILLVYPRASQPTRLVNVDLNGSENLKPALTKVETFFYNFDDAQHMAISPDGTRLALSLIYQNARSDGSRLGRTLAKLEVIDRATKEVISDIDIPNYELETAGMGGLAWLPDGKLGLAHIDSLIGPHKTIFERLAPEAGRSQTKFETQASFEEVVYDTVWVAGRWAVFASESGLWAYDLEEAKANHASPALLSGEAITDVDWR